MNNNIIFIGGFENTGTRLVVMFLQRLGYITKNTGSQLDYLDATFLKLFDKYYFTGDYSDIINNINKDFKYDSNVVIKHGHLCFLNKKLKLYYPNCKNILCIRNPLDILVKSSHNYLRYGKYSSISPLLLEKINHLNKWYSDEIVESSDVIIRMEDMVFDTVNTLKNLISKLNIVCDDKIIEDFCKEIKASNTIGKGSDILKTASKNEQFEINKLMEKFNYSN
jgi:hypothetical protein